MLSGCLKSPIARSRINKSLRWIVANSTHVLVPQLFVGNDKLCSEDLDLGLDYVLTRAISKARSTSEVPVSLNEDRADPTSGRQ